MVIALFVTFLSLGSAVGFLNRHHTEQQTNFWGHYVPMADHLRGAAQREELTYPMWGYSAVLLLLPNYRWVTGFQILLGTAIMTWLFCRLFTESTLRHRSRLLTILFVAAIPWYLLHSVKWPLSFSASLVVIGLLSFESAVRRSSAALAWAAGITFGITTYFRSEYLYLPWFIVAVAVVTHLVRGLPRVPVRLAAISAIAAWLVLIPWAIHFYGQTGRLSLTASQRGIVAFISLGQLPGNPWGAVYADEFAYDYLKERGITASATSDLGDRILFEEYQRRVKEHPGAFLAKAAWNGVTTLLQGFYPGDVPLSKEEFGQLTVLRQRFKSRLFLTEEPESSVRTSVSRPVYLAFAYWIAIKSVGALFFMLSTFGVVLAVVRGLRSPLLLMLAAFFAYQLMLVMVLATEPRYFNGLFLALVPFFIFAWSALHGVSTRLLRGGPHLPSLIS